MKSEEDPDRSIANSIVYGMKTSQSTSSPNRQLPASGQKHGLNYPESVCDERGLMIETCDDEKTIPYPANGRIGPF